MDTAYPLTGEIELTYYCNFKCPHCYCRGSEDKEDELTIDQLKSIIDQLQEAGCLNLTFTGGEPLLHPHFLDIYTYSQKKGFLISVFTNAFLLDKPELELFKKYRPFSIEITLNGLSQSVFDKTTGTRGNLQRTLTNIHALVKEGVRVVLKTIGMTTNKDEILQIKRFSDSLLGKGRFKFDPLVFCRLNGDKEPTKLRLSPEEINTVINADQDLLAERERILRSSKALTRDKRYLYQCIGRLDSFSISPFGKLRFCNLSDSISADLKTMPFKDAFFSIVPRYQNETFQTGSVCRDCVLRIYCCHCPARCYLETGSSDGPVEYFCSLAAHQRQLNEKKDL